MENNNENLNEQNNSYENIEKKDNKVSSHEPIVTYSSSNYTTVKEIKSKKQNNFSFSKNIAVPFLCGVLGAMVVVGTCFGVPSIKEQLLGTTNNLVIRDNDNSSGSINTDFISLKGYSETGVAVAQKVLPSVVGIKVEYSVNSIFGRGSSTATAEGSGVIITDDGYILTNNHIINTSSTSSFYEVSEASKVIVNLYNDETEYEGKIIGTDEQTDLAIIKIDKTGLTAAELGDSDTIQVGEFAMAIGNPLGMQSSVSAGMISALNREVVSDGITFNLIQTDTAINSGNSGGALVNSKGQVIGINTLKVLGTGVEGIGFAIPINSTKDIYTQLIQYKKVKRPYIGISGRDLDEKTANANNLVIGIYVVSIDEFSAAEKAGVKMGDVIIKADGKDIKTMDELNAIKNTHNIGDKMTIVVNRNGAEKELTLTLQEQ